MAARLALATEAAAVLSLASAAVALLPGPRISRLLGTVGAPLCAPPGAPPGADARRVGRAVERVARTLPWSPACLAQALATRAMLMRRGIACEAHLGVVGTRPLATHAWVTVNGVVVQGGPVRGATELASFR
jgi:Transglutaminase-like superfamily